MCYALSIANLWDQSHVEGLFPDLRIYTDSQILKYLYFQ